MSSETDDNTATTSVVGKQFVSISDYEQLLSRASIMERKLKAMENIQDLLRQKDLELRKCRNVIQQYQMALRKSEHRRMDSLHLIAKICQAKDRHGQEHSYEVEDESDKNKGFCLPCMDGNGKSLQKLDGTTVSSDVADGSTVLSQSPKALVVSATSKTSNEGDSILGGIELQNSSEAVAINPQKFRHETGTLLREDSCGQITNHLNENKMEIISRSICQSLKSNRDRTDQRQAFQSPHVSSMSKDLLTKLMQQNARLKKTLKDILSCKGASVEQYLGSEELKDTIIQLRQKLVESTNHMTELQKKIKTCEDMEQTEHPEFEMFVTVHSGRQDDSNKAGTDTV